METGENSVLDLKHHLPRTAPRWLNGLSVVLDALFEPGAELSVKAVLRR